MKTLIIVFSQTGNTRRVAEEIRRGILSETDDCQLLELKEVDPFGLAEYDLVGFGCPVFYYQEPAHVMEWIKQLPDLEGKKWFVFCTHGAIMGITLESLSDKLQEKGIRIVGCHDTYASATLPFYPYPMLTAGHPDKTELEEARIFGNLIARRICDRGKDGQLNPVPPPDVPREWRENAERFTTEFLQKIFPALSVNTSLCSRCYECQTNCPVDGIDINGEPPQIQDPCIYCWNCVNICPEAAVEADWSTQARLAPKLLERYRYWLNVAATQGKFRWRMDPESIDFESWLFRQRRRAADKRRRASKDTK